MSYKGRRENLPRFIVMHINLKFNINGTPGPAMYSLKI